GAVAEVVLDGVTGFVRDTPAELSALVGRIGELDRAACRRHVAERFSTEALVRGYTRLLAPARESVRESVRESKPVAAAPMVFSAPVPAPRPMRLPHDPPSPRRSDRARPVVPRVAG
ncbi:MAG TPA: hypothetical protein VNP03_15925, partial [Pseudonocardia sp.]|nr:hypothetical protein [Pseudonocardia sp.]